MTRLSFWEEELRDLPRDGGPAAVWVVRREGDGPATLLRVLCSWSAGGGPAPLPLGLVHRVLQTGQAAEQREESRSRRPPLCHALPLDGGRGTTGVLVAAATAAAPWADAVRLWAERTASRLGPLLDGLAPWPGTWLSATPPAEPWQLSLFAPEDLPVERRLAPATGLPLPRPQPVPGLPGAIGRSREMRLLAARIASVATSGVNVLLHGETGSGKEIIARALHQGSPRRDRPFVGLNCAALPANLFESELFGHKAGAFTGAGRDKPGLLEVAHGGSFFMDEIGDMPLALQIKLLRVMQERQVRRVGELDSRPVDIRFVAATHKDLAREIEDGHFRLDLYYRLKVVCLEIPPLRQRPEDVLPLLAWFLRRAGLDPARLRIADTAAAALHAWRWPGNVRELENEAARFAALYPGESLIELRHLNWEIQENAGPRVDAGDLGTLRNLEEANELLERYLIRKAIAASEGRKAAAARKLGLSRQGLYKKISRYGMVDLIGSAADPVEVGEG
ncbi:MAG TPA: sigma 54-interacting transcriptional regulator [Candidatus Krumholzibacteria bacterium]|nr:sigma 54-interacting transcriptional regulator [Candidatus Krumholzibacteria bacterium]HPD71271.1 sigma 54-interacting transcriptional regulator [Candidatus Krumholzibacteria bacterium]HRY39029.1 sigma 54-interacting transcriptional regulator [Candidatus Krumholzibacteria bacterium]